jgi:hypothetical protein
MKRVVRMMTDDNAVDRPTNDVDEIYAIVAPLIGMKPWSVRSTFRGFLILDFGEAHKQENMIYPEGDWNLCIDCAWRLQKPHDVLVASGDEQDFIRYEIKRLEGKTLERITISALTLDTELLFETGLSLLLFPVYTDDENEHWWLDTPGDKTLGIGPGVDWYHA